MALEDRALLASFTVNSFADSDSSGTLRWAIGQANANNQADTINFSSLFDTPQTITLGGGPLVLTDPATTTISGPGARLLTVNGAGQSGVFDIDAASAVISGLTVSDGSADNGGGFRNDGGTLTLTGVTISGNTATAMGGGLATRFGGTTDLIDCTVSGNTAGTGGGGLLNASSTMSLTNTTVAANTATTGSGGGLAISGGTTTLVNVTISANTAATGAGLSNSGGTLSLSNTIVAGNSQGDLSGTVTGGNSHNLIGVNPRLAPLGDYGGPFSTMALLPDSPAKGAGAPGAGIPTTDERGFARGAAIDIGAFQSQGVALVVNTTSDGVGSGSGQLSLRQAVNLANALTTADSITFDPGTFSVAQVITLTDGQLALSDQATTTITGPAASLTISGNHASRVFDIASGSATISGLTVSDGNAATGGGLQNDGGTLVLTSVTVTGNATSGNSGGGGVYSSGGSTTLGNCTISGNTANNQGGGVYARGGTLSLTSVTISSNTVTGPLSHAGGLYTVEGSATLHGCTISENTAVFQGGGLYNFQGTVTLTSCSVSGNTAKNGAGLGNHGGTLTLTNVAVNGNQGTGYGGGVYNAYGAVTLASCSVSGNTAKFGAGLYSGLGTNSITLTNSTLSGNTASQQGGGLANFSGTATLTGCTISGNSAPTAGGISTSGSNNTLTLTNSTVSGNTAGQTAGGLFSTSGTTTLVNVTVSANSAPTGGGIVNSANAATVTLTNTIVAGQKSGGDVSGTITGDHNVIGTNPLLTPLGDYGGPTQTMALLPGSPASGAGASGAGIPTTDQRGQPRSISVDIGAFQGQGTTLVVDTTTDGVGSGFGQLSLRQAINLVDAEPTADTIVFSPTDFQTPQTITLAGTGLLLTDTSGATTITAPAAGVTVSGGGTIRVFEINPGVTASISGLTITGGQADNGGGLYNNGGNVTLTNCTISENSSSLNVADAGGGGVRSAGGTTRLTDCTISGNSAVRDGGGLSADGGTMTLTNCTVSGNSAATHGGGGLFAFGGTTLTVVNSTFSGNSANTDGGGLYLAAGGSTTLTNCSVSGNSAAIFGGGIWAPPGSTTTLTNTIVAANSAPTRVDVSGTLVASSANNLIGDATGMSGISNGSQGNQVGTAQAPIDPLLSPLGNFGGPTQTQGLLPGSPGIAQGAAGTGVPTTDQRGVPRSNHVDVGAFQSQGFTLTPVAGSTPQSAIIGRTFANPLAVTVVGVNPVEPVDGGFVTFVVNPSGGSSGGISATTPTIQGGTASVSITANSIPGNFTVSVSAIGAASGASFALTNTEVPSLVVNTTQDVVNSIDGTTSLREAIDFAMTLSTPSTIAFSPAVFGTTAQTITLTLGSLPLGNAATTTIVGPGAGLLIISGNQAGRVFDVSGSAALSGLTITQGQSDPDNGAGIRNMHGTLTLTDCTITGNVSDIGAGAGVYALDGTTTLSGCVVTSNTGGVGAGLSIEGGTATITSSTIANNTGAIGGGLFVGRLGSVTITNSAISGNTSVFGGGMCLEEGATAVLTGCTLSGNSANNTGGQGGGGAAILSGTATLTNCTVSNNSAPDAPGGGLYNESTLSLINCTVSGNSAATGGGLASTSGSTSTLVNTIVAGQKGGGDVAGQFTGAGNMIGGNPLLTPLGDYGGPTPTMALLPGSPATGGGTVVIGVPTTDQRGFARGASIDIGAFQTQAVTQVNTTADGVGSGLGQLSLRQAVNLANAQPSGDTISFDAAVFASSPKTITLTSGPISLTDKAITTISGPGAGLLTVSGGGQSQVFDIVGGSATLSGLTVSGGNAQNGGGLENDNGTLTLSNVIVSGNTATGNGGGVYTASGGSTTLSGVTVSGNTAATGGGVAVFSGGTGTLTNATIAGNTATSSGGGLADSGGTLTMFNVTVSNNQGGGLVVSGSFANASLQNTIVAGNAGGNVSGGFTDATNQIGGNPLLAPLGNYGGQTPTMPLLPGSPAIGAGSKGLGVPTIDQRGLPRPTSEPIDTGAFQSQGFSIAPVTGSTPQSTDVTDAFAKPLAVTVTAKNAVEPVNGGVVTFTLNSGTGASATLSAATAVIASGQAAVTATANSTPGNYTVSASAAGAGTASFALSNTENSGLRITTVSDVVNPFDNLTSLREAVAYANAHPGSDTIVFDPTVFGKRPRTIRLIGGPIVLTDPATTTIIGPGVRKLTIQRKGKSRVFDIDGGSLALSRVTIIGGNAGKRTGGALRNDGGSLRLKHVAIAANRAFVGGGLFNGGRTTLSGVTIKHNRVLIGGNVFNTTRAMLHWHRLSAVQQETNRVSRPSQERTEWVASK